MSAEKRTDAQVPTPFEASLSPENKARLKLARTQFNRVDRVLQSTGLKDATGVVINEGYLVRRTFDSVTYVGNQLYGDGESLFIQSPVELEGFLEPDLSTELVVDPGNDNKPLRASYSYRETEENDLTTISDFDLALARLSDTLDELGFPPAEEEQAAKQLDLSPDDIDGLHAAGIRIVDPRTYELVTTEGSGSMGIPTPDGIARTQAHVLLEGSGKTSRIVPADMDDLKS